MKRVRSDHFAHCFIKTVSSIDQAIQELKSRKQGSGDFIFWQDPQRLSQIQITFATHKNMATFELEYKTIHCLTSDADQIGGMRKLQQFVAERLITVVVFDTDWTLTKYHTHYEWSKCPMLEGGILNYAKMLRFPGVATVLQAIAKRPELKMAVATGSHTPEHAKGVLNQVFPKGWDQYISQIIYQKHKRDALPEIVQNFNQKIDASVVQKKGQLSLDPKVGILGLAHIIFVNDHKIENESIKQLSNSVVEIIPVDNRSNDYLIKLNKRLNLGLTIGLADLGKNVNDLSIKPEARIICQLFVDSLRESDSTVNSSQTDDTHTSYDDDDEEFVQMLEEGECLSSQESRQTSPGM